MDHENLNRRWVATWVSGAETTTSLPSAGAADDERVVVRDHVALHAAALEKLRALPAS